MKENIRNKTWFLAALLLIVAVIYTFYEIRLKKSEDTDAQQSVQAEAALQSAANSFNQFEYSFAQNSRSLARYLKEEIEAGSSRDQIFDLISQYDFWGISIFEDANLWLWSGFGQQSMSAIPDTSEEQIVDIQRVNNVTFLNSHVPFFVESEGAVTRYDLVSRKKIQQENILPIGRNVELDPASLFQSNNEFPIYFSFFETLPDSIHLKTTISTQSTDSAGVIYTFAEDQILAQDNVKAQNEVHRSVFHVLLIVLAMLLFLSIAKRYAVWKEFVIKILTICSAWALLSYLGSEINWAELLPDSDNQHINTLPLIIRYSINSLFVLLLSTTSINAFTSSNLHITIHIRRLFPAASGFYGLCSFLLLYFFISETYLLFVNSSISVMDLNIFPPIETLVVYVAAGVFSISIFILLSLLGWFLMKNTTVSQASTLLLVITGFSFGFLLLKTLTSYGDSYNWISLTISVAFIVILFFTQILFKKPNILTSSSPLRLLLLMSFLTVCLTYIALFKGYTDRLNDQLLQAAESFIEEEASEAERIASNLLTELEQAMSELSARDFVERPTFVESFFTQQTQEIISEEWESFSISTQLINNSGEIIGEYTSDLDSPGWTRAFNMLSLEIPFQEERIRIHNLRPIIRERPLNEANANYSSFRRAWIPLYDNATPTNRIGWILCSVYRERPQFEKPLRAVIAAEGNEKWDSSINITEYVDGLTTRKSILGVPLELPGYIRLPDSLQKNIEQDSILLRVRNLEDGALKELFVQTKEGQIIRAATNYAGFDNHLFSILRYFFSVLISGVIMLGALAWTLDVVLFGRNQRFRDRLIDRFILASLLCLLVLTITSYYAINTQNEKNVRNDLLEKVANLSEVLSQQESSAGESIGSLQELSSTLNSDASIFIGETLNISTTSQIYGQHLLPRLLPWEVYNSIYLQGNNQATQQITLGYQELLIGYRPWMNNQGEIAGIVAIPTFLEAPKFNEQLLSTTSYLLGFYVVIFGLFILGAALISTQLTAPLHSLREGLKKISGGDLQTTLPVRSKDEIGSLTNAYNIMVYRLKALQQDLAKAEREAAWKEMAQQVAHEIKNPLTPMKLNLQHLQRQLKVPEAEFNKMKPQIERTAANMIEQIESLSQIASDFSNFARPIDQEFKPVEFNELINSIADLYEPEKNLTLNTILSNEEIWVEGVKEELRRVLINLVKNAYEAIPKTGTITIGSSINEGEKTAFITIEDEGEGIPEENYENIFVPNFSTKSSGTGLGLAISKKIIEEHGGEISFNSAVGKGTTFTIQLPLAEKKEA